MEPLDLLMVTEFRLVSNYPRFIPANKTVRTMTVTNGCANNQDRHVVYLEHVVVRLSISHPRRGDLQINLTSPSGTRSQLLARR